MVGGAKGTLFGQVVVKSDFVYIYLRSFVLVLTCRGFPMRHVYAPLTTCIFTQTFVISRERYIYFFFACMSLWCCNLERLSVTRTAAQTMRERSVKRIINYKISSETVKLIPENLNNFAKEQKTLLSLSLSRRQRA